MYISCCWAGEWNSSELNEGHLPCGHMRDSSSSSFTVQPNLKLDCTQHTVQASGNYSCTMFPCARPVRLSSVFWRASTNQLEIGGSVWCVWMCVCPLWNLTSPPHSCLDADVSWGNHNKWQSSDQVQTRWPMTLCLHERVNVLLDLDRCFSVTPVGIFLPDDSLYFSLYSLHFHQVLFLPESQSNLFCCITQTNW